MRLVDTINLNIPKIHASGTSEGAVKAWDTRGRGRAATSNNETQQYLHKGFHDTLSKLGYKFQYSAYTSKAATPHSAYYHPTSQRSVHVTEGGQWSSKKGDSFAPKDTGNAPGEFFQKYHIRK